MEKFIVTVEESISRNYSVEATSRDEAQDIVNALLSAEEIELDYERDYKDTEVEAYADDEGYCADEHIPLSTVCKVWPDFGKDDDDE